MIPLVIIWGLVSRLEVILMEPLHIFPLNDLKEHDTNSDRCWCRPDLNADGNYVHHSADGRELLERLVIQDLAGHIIDVIHHCNDIQGWENYEQASPNIQIVHQWIVRRLDLLASMDASKSVSRVIQFEAAQRSYLRSLLGIVQEG